MSPGNAPVSPPVPAPPAKSPRALPLATLKMLFDKVEPGSAAWAGRVQASADAVYALLKQPAALTDGQFAAIASLADSVTVPTFTGSRLNRLVDAGNHVMALYEFQKWVYGPDPVTGLPVVLPSLIARRDAEQALYLS